MFPQSEDTIVIDALKYLDDCILQLRAGNWRWDSEFSVTSQSILVDLTIES